MRAIFAKLVLWLIGHPVVVGKTVGQLSRTTAKLAVKLDNHQGQIATALEARSAAIVTIAGEVHALTQLKK